MYAALTYFGNGVLICTSSVAADNGKTVKVTEGTRSWSKTIAEGKATFTLPCKKKYHVELMNASTTEYETDVFINFGEIKELTVGMDKRTWKGLKAIVNAGKEAEMIEAGDQISAEVGAETHVFDVIDVDYRVGTYGHNIVLGKHTALSTPKSMNATDTNAGGYNTSLMSHYLDEEYFNSLPDDMKSVITEMTFQASIGNQSQVLQNETHKIWLPLEYNVFGATTYAAASEVSTGGAEQFAYFVTAANRIKTLGNSGSACDWWESSPRVSNAANFCAVGATGGAYLNFASIAIGVVPCFLIAADA